MSARSTVVSRYQRRILAWGGTATCLLYVIGAPVYLGRVEDDLTSRVTDELAAAGIDGVTVSFSGQSGSVRCDAPLPVPRRALDIAYGVRGVRSMSLSDDCRVLIAGSNDVDDTDDTDDTGDIDDTGSDEAAATNSTIVGDDRVADFETVVDVLAGNPRFSLLSQLFSDADLTGLIDGSGGPVTLFAPTDTAFDDLPADLVARLRSDPDLLAELLAYHVVPGRFPLSSLIDGPVRTEHGDTVEIEIGPSAIRVDGVTIEPADVLAASGVVLAVDSLLFPDGLDLGEPDRLAEFSAVFDGSGFVLDGVVADDQVRSALVTATTSEGTAPVDDLIVDADVGLGADVADGVVSVLIEIPTVLVDAELDFDGVTFTLSGTYLPGADLSGIEEVAGDLSAVVLVGEQPALTSAGADRLESDLNALVADSPILFAPGSATLDPSSTPVLDSVAAMFAGAVGAVLTVEGHTDSSGDPQRNVVLSEQRAERVVDELIARGVVADSIRAEGFGSSRPVLVDGVEDRERSRRVEFRVDVADTEMLR